MQGTIQSLHIYPIKSASGIELNNATIQRAGFDLDRRWMLINEANGFVSQRQIPKMALLSVSISDHLLCVNYPGQPELQIPIESSGSGEEIDATMHRRDESIKVIAEDKSISAWFSDALEKPLRLVRISPRFTRRIPDDPNSDTSEVELADGYPYLITSTASLARVNDRLLEHNPHTPPLEMKRFRPNIVIDIDEPWAEMHPGLSLKNPEGTIEFQLAKTCQRCGIPQINPTTSEKDTGVELHRFLKDLYHDAERASNDFGQNAIPVKGTGREIKTGMEIEISTSET